MGFQKLQLLIKNFLAQAGAVSSTAERTRIRTEVLQEFTKKQRRAPHSFWQRIWTPQVSTATISIATLLVLLNAFSIFPGKSVSAGEIVPQFGPVEIVRDKKTIMVTERTTLNSGDIVRVGNRASAELIFDQFTSVANDRTEVKILGEDSLFLSSGSLENNATESGEILTERGMVRLQPGAEFQMNVSGSGETHIVLRKNRLAVSDLFDRETVMKGGEELRLRTDTELSLQEIPEDLQLSTTQILAVESKLVIARTKLLSSIEHFRDKNQETGTADFESAQKTFRSIAQVLNSSRNLTIIKRTNFGLIKNEDVFAMVSHKTQSPILLSEIRAVEILLNLVETQHDRFAFSKQKTDVASFDRFVLLDRVFQFASPEEQKYGDILKQEYILSFYRKIMNEPLKIDQASRLNEELEKMAETEITRSFLLRVKKLLAPDLAELLAEKMQKQF
ncbi:hypothetical protein HN954_04155 [bacterium]|jgi:hypothetical protein|nr:hypothetical protein [bacterium]MBT6831769.1 hypothetical protein [bacterium]MBT6996592.1 hypothetical protein [bacterium]MBT7772918.1 hypothetical protein [bacterium]